MKSFMGILIALSMQQASLAQTADSINKQELQRTVAYLSADSLQGRLAGTSGAINAGLFIANAFREIGLRQIEGMPEYLDRFEFRYEGIDAVAFNVAAILPPAIPNDTIVIFSAHYDHIGYKPLAHTTLYEQVRAVPAKKDHANDSIYNGANDNASGVAALLALARYYSSINTHKYILCFVAFSAEEEGLLGSEWFAGNVKPKLIKAVINMDMIGRPDSKTGNKCMVVCNKDKQIISLFNNRLLKEQMPGNFFTRDIYPSANFFSRGDQFSFANKVKRSILLTTTSAEDPFYHTRQDEYDTINFDFLLKTTRNIAVACRTFTE